jgi:hypothetical protein
MATIQFIQAQSFVLSAAGQSAGDTSITVQSFKYSDGITNIVTADLGTQCYGTLEPNNGAQEEAIQFTGVTQNANGTATLTGVSSVGFNYPYTVTSGLAKSHSGGATFILSNDAAMYGNLVTYINNTASSGAALASNLIAGLTKLSVSPATGSNPIAVGDNDNRVLASGTAMYVNSIKNTGIPYAVATGTSTAYTVTLASSISTLASGTYLNFVVPTTNATGVSLNINSLGAKPIVKNYNVTLASGDLITGQIVETVFDGTNFQTVSPISTGGYTPTVNSGTTTKDISSTTSTVIAHGLGITPKIVHLSASYSNISGTFGTCYTQASVTGSSVSGTYTFIEGGTQVGTASGNGFVIYQQYSGGIQSLNETSVTLDATNITIAWSKTSTPTGTAYISWDALA